MNRENFIKGISMSLLYLLGVGANAVCKSGMS